MSFFEWSEGLNVGVTTMNDEHKKLINIMNRLHERNSAGAPKSELNSIIKELASYVVGHFQREEAYMESVQFPGIETHKLIHQNLLKKYGDLAKEFEVSTGKVSDNFFHFLKAWLSTHIRGIDIKYGEHCKAAKKAA